MSAELHGRIWAQQLADILPVGVAIVNSQDEPVFVNRRFRELTTCRPVRTLTGFDSLSHSIHVDDYDRVADDYATALSTKRAIRTEYRAPATANTTPQNQHQPRDQDPGEEDGEGEEVWRALTLSPLSSEEALEQFGLLEQGGLISTITDITLEKKAELLQRKIAKDARDHKLQQERFIDMISHEVRNPLSAILHCAEDIMDAVHGQQSGSGDGQDAGLGQGGGELMAKIAEAAETINLCVAHQKRIIDDVLIFSKLDALMLTLRPREVQPKTHLARLLTMFRPELRKSRIEFDYKLDQSYASCDIDWVMADLDKMAQVLINLVSNAIKFTAEAEHERKIQVSMGASKQRPPSYPPNVVFFEPSEAALCLNATGESEWGDGEVAYIMVAVKDTGIGISDQHQKRLFERFNQATPRTDRIYGGFGLGLNISRRLCHMHGGEIGVSSKEGHGSTFGFFFSVRRSDKVFNGNAGGKARIDQLCYQIQELDSKVPDIDRDTSGSEIPLSQPVTKVDDVAPNAASNEKKQHTELLYDEINQGKGMSPPNNEPQKPASNLDEFSTLQCPRAILSKAKTAAEGRRILFVEDNIINQRVVSRKLKMSGFDVTEASNGREALNAWRRGTFDCILMDQQMPVMDGNSATREIRASERDSGEGEHIPILGVTANVRYGQQSEMLDAGMDGILHKPYKMQELCDKVLEMVAKPSPEE